MTREELEALWSDRRNYRWGLYYCKADPRVIVPKRIKWMGWTVNAARPSAFPVTLLLIAIIVVPMIVAAALRASSSLLVLVEVLSIALLCMVCAYMSSRTD